MPEWIDSLLSNTVGLTAAGAALASAIVYVLVANLAWRAQTNPNSRLAVRLRALGERSDRQLAFQSLRIAYYVGVPFVALLLGWVDLRAMGLALMDWAQGTRWAIVLGLGAWLVLMVIWVPYLRATASVPAPSRMAEFTLARRVYELILMQAHWAFYRAAAIVLLTGMVSDPIYWGTVLGLGLVCCEAFAAPQAREHLSRVGQADWIVWNAGQMVINSLLFIVTVNLWLLALVHLALEVTVPHLRPVSRPVVPRPPAPPAHWKPAPRK